MTNEHPTLADKDEIEPGIKRPAMLAFLGWAILGTCVAFLAAVPLIVCLAAVDNRAWTIAVVAALGVLFPIGGGWLCFKRAARASYLTRIDPAWGAGAFPLMVVPTLGLWSARDGATYAVDQGVLRVSVRYGPSIETTWLAAAALAVIGPWSAGWLAFALAVTLMAAFTALQYAPNQSDAPREIVIGRHNVRQSRRHGPLLILRLRGMPLGQPRRMVLYFAPSARGDLDNWLAEIARRG